MTRDVALLMIAEYGAYFGKEGTPLQGIRERFPEDGSTSKAMRWLGFCQGYLVAEGALTLADVKEQSRVGRVIYGDGQTVFAPRGD